MIYILPNGDLIDLGDYILDDCKPYNDDNKQNDLAELLFSQKGILVADMEGGEKRNEQ